jgi:hypothetical protein
MRGRERLQFLWLDPLGPEIHSSITLSSQQAALLSIERSLLCSTCWR